MSLHNFGDLQSNNNESTANVHESTAEIKLINQLNSPQPMPSTRIDQWPKRVESQLEGMDTMPYAPSPDLKESEQKNGEIEEENNAESYKEVESQMKPVKMTEPAESTE